MKLIFKITIVLVTLLLGVTILTIESLDTTPYFESDYYRATKSRFDSLCHGMNTQTDSVAIGFGKQSLTPDFLNTAADKDGVYQYVPLAGYGGRLGSFCSSVHDSIFVKAIAIKSGDELMVFVGIDLLIMPPNITDMVVDLLKDKGIGRSNLVFSATHSHSSLGGWSSNYVGEMFAGPENGSISRWISVQIFLAVVEAVNDLRPGNVGHEKFMAKAFVKNRLVGEDGIVNPDFMLLVFSQAHGRKAVLGSFDAHATTLGEWNMEISGDYPGYWQRRLEQDAADMAVFFAGSVGSHSYRSKGEKFEKARYLGEALADSVIKYLPVVELQPIVSLTTLTIQVVLPEFHIRISDGLRLKPWLAQKLFPPVGNVHLQALKINDLIWATAPSDFSGETAVAYKNALAKRGFDAMVTSFNGGYTGYIIPCKYYHLNAYESRMMNWFGPSYNPFINHMLGEMMNKVAK